MAGSSSPGREPHHETSGTGALAGGPGQLGELCRRVLTDNWREGVRDGVRFAYTAPSPQRYPWQWYWDSCFAAIAWRRFDPGRARRELETLLAASRPNGFIGHTIFWKRPVDRLRGLFYNVCSRSDFMTSTIQPPLLAWAWRLAVGDPAGVPGILRHHDCIERERDLDGDGLVWIMQPDESGLDASPAFDSIWSWRSCGLPGFPLLVSRNRRHGFDLRRVDAAGGPVVCDTQTNVLHGLSRLSLGRSSITDTLLGRLYDERHGVFHQLIRRRGRLETRRLPVLTWAALAPLALPDLPEDIGHRIVERYLLDPRHFWLPVPPASVSRQESTFSRRDRWLFLRRYWRGPTWINAAWLLWLGLRRLGYGVAAADMAARLAAAVRAAGLREYYDPFTGRGMGARNFAWSALVMEMADPDRDAVAHSLGAATSSATRASGAVVPAAANE
jgi:Glycosyl hydrolase family 63 C-terminal domain